MMRLTGIIVSLFVLLAFTFMPLSFAAVGNPLNSFDGSDGGGTLFGDPFGVAVDSLDRIIVPDAQRGLVQIYTSDGEFITSFDGSNGDEEFANLYGVAVNSLDRIIVTDTELGLVQIFDSSGRFIHSFNGGDDEGLKFITPREVTVDSNDRIIVTDNELGLVQIYGSDGGFISSFDGSNGGTSFIDPYGVAVDNQNNIIVSDINLDSVQTFTSAGRFISSFDGTNGGEPFAAPFGVTVDNENNIIVSDASLDSVQTFTSSGVFTSSFDGSDGDGVKFSASRGLAVDSNHNIIVADAGKGLVQIYESDGAFNNSFDGTGDSNTQFDTPYGIAVDSNDRIIVSDVGLSTVQVYTSAGEFITSIDGSDDGGGTPFGTPYTIAVDSDDRIVVVDPILDVIQIFDSTGRFISSFDGSNGGEPFRDPFGVAVDSLDRIIVSDSSLRSVQLFNFDGSFISSFDGSNGGTLLISPYGVAVDNDDRIIVFDTYNDLVQIFTSNGEFISSIGDEGSEIEFNSIFGIAVDNDNRIIISDIAKDYVQIFDSEGNFLDRFNDNFGRGLAVDSNNRIIVAENSPGSIQIYEGYSVETIPDAPTNLIATVDGTHVFLTWTAPLDDGGSPIIDYLVDIDDGSGWVPFAHGDATVTQTFTDLTNGQSYDFRVAAVNSVGRSTSYAFATVSLAVIPDAPIDLRAVFNDSQVTLFWTIPFDGGSPITGYLVEYKLTSELIEWIELRRGTANSSIIFGLSNGQSYDFRISAINSVDQGTSSTISGTPVAPNSAPFTPTNLIAIPDNRAISLEWFAPFEGSSPITDYLVEVSDDDGINWETFADGINTETNVTVADLTNGQSYDFRVSAINEFGTSDPSDVVPATPNGSIAVAPSAPTNLIATPFNMEIGLSWDVPFDGGSPITGYLVEYKLSTEQIEWTEFPHGIVPTDRDTSVFPLSNGESYDLRVSAINEFGTSIPSDVVDATPVSVPGHPTNLVAERGNFEVTLTWTAPSDNGGLPITDYIVEYSIDGGDIWITFDDGISTETSTTVTDLSNGQSYDFRVAAVNEIGSDDTSNIATATPLSPDIPSSPPDAPTNLIATPDNSEVTLTWTAPSDNGGSPIIDYIVEYIVDGGDTWIIFDDGISTVTSVTVTGLTNGDLTGFRVFAVNGIGTSLLSSDSAYTTPATTPDAPTNLTAIADDTIVTLSWIEPFDGGSPIVYRTVEFNDGTGWVQFADDIRTTSAIVTGLTNGLSYDFRVSATSEVGYSALSDVVTATPLSPVTPSSPPDAPTGLTATPGDAEVYLTWTAPSDGSSQIIDYFVEYSDDAGSNWNRWFDDVSTETSTTVTGLINGQSYDFRVSVITVLGVVTLSNVVDAIPEPDATDDTPTDDTTDDTPTDDTTDDTTDTIEEEEPVKKKGNGGCGDCTPPTLGLDKNYKRVVDNGFSYNGNPTQVETWYTPFPLINATVGEMNTVEIIVYENNGINNMKWVQFGLGAAGIGQPLNDLEVLIEVWFDTLGSNDDIAIEKIIITDKDNLIESSSVSAVADVVKCTTDSQNERCVKVTLEYSYRESTINHIMVVNVADIPRNSQSFYFNDGVQVLGDSMNPTPYYIMQNKQTSQQTEDLTIALFRTDKINHIWTDGNGIEYLQISENRFDRITPAEPYKCTDPPLSEVNVPTRQNCHFRALTELWTYN